MADTEWPSRFRPVLRKLVAGGWDYFGADVIAVETVRQVERPFSTLLQIRVGTAAALQGAFIKIVKPRTDTPAEEAATRQNVLRDFEMTRRVRQALAGHAGLAAVRPIACFPEEMALVTGEVLGPTLAQVLAHRAAGWPRAAVARELSNLIRQAGAWLKAAQAGLPEEREVSLEGMRTYLDRRLDDLEASGTIRLTKSGRSTIERYRDRLISEVGTETVRPVWIHADFCPENIITRDGEITVLDFMMAKTGTVYHDVAHLFMHLDSMKVKPWFRPVVIDTLQRDLLTAFEPGLAVDRPLFALVLLQHVICHIVTLQAAGAGSTARLYRARLHRRHRRWLTQVAGLDNESWTQ